MASYVSVRSPFTSNGVRLIASSFGGTRLGALWRAGTAPGARGATGEAGAGAVCASSELAPKTSNAAIWARAVARREGRVDRVGRKLTGQSVGSDGPTLMKPPRAGENQ